MTPSSYPFLSRHGIISGSNDDPGSIITFLIDRMAMADENADNREGQTWHAIQSNDDLKTPFNNFNIINEIMRIGEIMGSTVSSSEVGVMIIEALLYVKQNFSSDQTNSGTRMLMMMAIADQVLDDRELNLFFDYGKWAQKDSDRIKSLETLSKVCKDANISYSKEKIQSLINKVNDTDSEPKKEIGENKWKLGTFEIYEDDGSEEVLNKYLKSVDRMIQSLKDQPIEFLQNNTSYLEKVRKEAEGNGNCIDGNYFIFFAFSGNAEKCAELMRIKSGESQFEARFYFYDLPSEKFCSQSVNNGEWESGWITDLPKDEFFSSDLMGFKVSEKIKDNLKILEKNGSKDLHENLHSKLKNSINKDLDFSNYPLLLKHNIIGSDKNPDLPIYEKSSSGDAGCVMTFLIDRMAMADEKVDDGEGQMWHTIQGVDDFREAFNNMDFAGKFGGSEIKRIGKILGTTVSIDEVDDMINEALFFVEKEFNSNQQTQGLNMLMSMAMADGDLDNRELDLLFDYGKITQESSVRIEFFNYLVQVCKDKGVTYSEDKIKSLINKVNNPNAEPKKETVVKQMIALPDGTTADLLDTSHWNIGAFELHYEDGEEEGLKEYLETVQKMIYILSDQPIEFLQDNDLFLEKVIKESKEEEYCIEVYLWFAFPGKAEKCAEVMRTISGEAQFYGAINFYDMFEKRFWYQGVDHGEWETGWIESGYDESYFATYFEGLGIPEDIKTNYEYLKNNGLDEFKDYLHSNVLLDESDWTEAYINQLYNDKNYVEGAKKGDELILKLAKNQNFNIHHCCDIAMDEDNRFPVDVKIALTSNPNLEGYMITEMFERDKRFNYKDPEYRKVDELLLKHPNCPKDFISKHIHKFQSEPVSKPDVVSDVKTLTIKCDGNFSKGNLLGLSVYSYDSSNHDTIMNTLKSTEDINAEVMDNLPIKLIKDYYGFRDSSFLSINLNNSPLSVNIKNNEVDFSKDLENDSLLIQEFPISGLISIELEHSKDIIFNQNQIKHFPNNSLITSVLVNDEEYDFNDYTDPHTYFSDQFFTKTFSKKNENKPSKKQLELENPKEKNVPAWKKIKTAMESFGPLYAAEYGEIMDYCNKHFGAVKKSTFRTYIISCTVNHNSRIHYSPNKKERKDLLDNDVLYQVEEGMVTLYEPKKHGHWYIKKGNEGKLHIEKF